ncbi:hypothetical protein [Eleftheria terrae]|uniref:hypothetical protein n=1 Tax=Eleftheria terrae TaxID=1597781 RepID=UPI00263A91DA|nr:hypothetical protein [Eleftheria terrae]WKB55365.1 hypothetical protein N7L95_25115 [Eleftheria terrae]
MTPTLIRLQDSLAAARRAELPVSGLVATWRAGVAELPPLPPRYGQVLEALLTQLESGSLFTEESCSFSQQDLMDKLHGWLEKAAEQLQPPPA